MEQFYAPSVNPNFTAILGGGGGGAIARRALELSGAEKPNVLFIPSAIESEKAHAWSAEDLAEYYQSLGLEFDVLHDYIPAKGHSRKRTANLKNAPTREELEDKISNTDVIAIGGGNTKKMIQDIWKPLGIDTELLKAIDSGTVISGASAGAIALFTGGHSDWQASETYIQQFDPSIGDKLKPLRGWNYAFTEGIDVIRNTIAIPHFNSRTPMKSLRGDEACNMIVSRARKGKMEIGIGLDNEAALEILPGGLARTVGKHGLITIIAPGPDDILRLEGRIETAEHIPFNEYVGI